MHTDNSGATHIELSIIIISFNTSSLTCDCVDSIYTSMQHHNETNFEIVVLDNASTDDSVIKLRNFSKSHSNFKLIQSTTNLGFSKGNNEAERHATGTYLLFLNSDTKVLHNAIEELLKCAHTHPDYAFFGGKLLNTDMSAQPSCGPFYTPFVVFAALFLKGDYWGLTRQSPDHWKPVGWVSGACILTKKEHFEIVDRFDERIFMYMEEIDLLYRAKKRNLLTCFCPEAQFIHYGSASSGGKTYPILQVYRGFVYFYKKHYGLFNRFLLRNMLQLKARIAIAIGNATGNHYLIHTYAQALTIAQMA